MAPEPKALNALNASDGSYWLGYAIRKDGSDFIYSNTPISSNRVQATNQALEAWRSVAGPLVPIVEFHHEVVGDRVLVDVEELTADGNPVNRTTYVTQRLGWYKARVYMAMVFGALLLLLLESLFWAAFNSSLSKIIVESMR